MRDSAAHAFRTPSDTTSDQAKKNGVNAVKKVGRQVFA